MPRPRARVVTTDHIMLTGILDNTSQVHCNQWMVEQQPERYVGGQAFEQLLLAADAAELEHDVAVSFSARR